MIKVTGRRVKIEGNRYLSVKIVVEISNECNGDWKGNRKASWRGGECDSSFCWEYISSLLLPSPLEPRLSAPGFHTHGASHPIITLKWLLPHQWRTGRLAPAVKQLCMPHNASHLPYNWLSDYCAVNGNRAFVKLLWLSQRVWLESCIVGWATALHSECRSLKVVWLWI